MIKVENVKIYKNDIPLDIFVHGDIAVDTETVGLNIIRDRLCLVQIADESGNLFIVQFDGNDYSAPNLKKLLTDQKREKIFHFARFDVATIYCYLSIIVEPVYCTKIASRIARTYSSSHSLKELCCSLLSVKLNKQQQCSNWADPNLTKEQILYAASDVAYLHRLRNELNNMLESNKRREMAYKCFKCVGTIAELDIKGWDATSLFNHSMSPSYQ